MTFTSAAPTALVVHIVFANASDQPFAHIARREAERSW